MSYPTPERVRLGSRVGVHLRRRLATAVPGDDPLEDGSPDDDRLMPTGFVEWFVVAQTAIPAMVVRAGQSGLPPAAPNRRLRQSRSSASRSGGSIAAPVRDVRHPAQRWLVFIVFYLSLMIFHPLTSGLLAGVAQTLLYAAIFCAVFWAPAFVTRPRQLVRILAILLVCNGINSMVGVMQVYDPQRWMPSQLSLSLSRLALQAATYIGPNGVAIIRPPGLFDTPGAVCGPGTVAALLGLVFAIEHFAWWKRGIALMFSLAGISAIYLSHVRANFVITIGMMVVYAVALLVQNQKTRLTAFASLCAGVIVVGLTVSTVLGGESIKERFATLLGDDPRGLYLDVARQAAEERLQRPRRTIPVRRRPRALGDDARLLRRSIEARIDRDLGRGAAHRSGCSTAGSSCSGCIRWR